MSRTKPVPGYVQLPRDYVYPHLYEHGPSFVAGASFEALVTASKRWRRSRNATMRGLYGAIIRNRRGGPVFLVPQHVFDAIEMALLRCPDRARVSTAALRASARGPAWTEAMRAVVELCVADGYGFDPLEAFLR